MANENVPLIAVEALRADGHDVGWIRIDAPGSSDDNVLARALLEKRVLITFDKDFGMLVYHRGATASSGVVLVRLALAKPRELASFVARSLGSRSDWEGHFSVVEPGRIRMRKLR